MKLIKTKKGDLELDELGKLLIALVLIVILIYIVVYIIGGEFGSQGENIVDTLDTLK